MAPLLRVFMFIRIGSWISFHRPSITIGVTGGSLRAAFALMGQFVRPVVAAAILYATCAPRTPPSRRCITHTAARTFIFTSARFRGLAGATIIPAAYQKHPALLPQRQTLPAYLMVFSVTRWKRMPVHVQAVQLRFIHRTRFTYPTAVDIRYR